MPFQDAIPYHRPKIPDVTDLAEHLHLDPLNDCKLSL